DAFVKAFVDATRATPVGDPADPSTFIGPIISPAQVASVEGFIDDTVKAGAKVVLEGSTDGNLIHPWIFDQVTNDMPAAANEVFGPVCCIITAKDEDDAIALANETEHGLSGSVFTEDLYRGFQVAKRMRTGMVHVNDQSIGDEPHVMFGGEKASGVGRFNAQWVVDRFTTDRWISIQREKRF
ncbi:MAG: aldehyde dehydrogenase family protein, partial [Propionibacteriaceae bacterium]|nr:aldehyde dehydrogenase family protein [Propionibacteriaceae bacterium]